MARVLLISPSNSIGAERQNWTHPHLGIWRIAGWLDRHGHEVVVWDTILDEGMPPGRFDLIGMSLTHDTLPDDLSMLRKLRKLHPDAKIVAGGVEASSNYGQVFGKVPGLDCVILGEGEPGMLSLADGDAFWHSGPGVVARVPNPISHDEFFEYCVSMPFRDMRHREHWAITKKLRPQASMREIRTVRLNTSTYCDRACKFCSLTHVHRLATGGPVSPISLTGLETVEVVEKVKRDLPETCGIYFNDDCFFTVKAKAESFFEHAPALDYHIQARPDTLDHTLLPMMARQGCRRISFGVENFSQDVLNAIGKGFQIGQAEEVLNRTDEAGIHPIVLLMLFPPTTTMDDLVLNWRKMRWCRDRGWTISILSYIRAYRGSWYFESGMHDISWTKRQGVKQPHAILPDDPDVRALWREFERRVAEREGRMADHWKGKVSGVMADVLGDLLKKKGAV
jgi:radical SAM superfamily enzyme YgiQ (UPF0313 family)